MNNYVFLNSKYKQFDGEKEYCNFSCNIGMLQTRALLKPPKELQLALKNQLLDYSHHYCTETNVILLLNTCNFRCKFWFIFSLILSENAPNVHFREAKIQHFPGMHDSGPL